MLSYSVTSASEATTDFNPAIKHLTLSSKSQASSTWAVIWGVWLSDVPLTMRSETFESSNVDQETACQATMKTTAPSSNPISKPTVKVVSAYQEREEAIKILIIFFSSLTIYNALELLILIHTTCKSLRSLYFWSLLISSVGLVPYALGFTFKLLDVWGNPTRWVGLALLTLGWYAMVTGHSVVLWSRLHLVVSGEKGRKVLKYTKWMIMVNAGSCTYQQRW